MLAKSKFTRIRKMTSGLALALLLSVLWPVAATPQPLQAADEEYGYLWSLVFNFDNNYDGLLTVEVGPWQNGDLVEVKETSTTTVSCKPSGAVALAGGSASFKGGHIECEMDLSQIVMQNHGLKINPVDNYGSIVLRTRINSAANTVVPIFTHPDAQYSIDFTQTSAVTLNEKLWNNAGLLQATFPGITINTWQTYSYLYSCISNGGPCSAYYYAGPQSQSAPTAGSRTQWSTGATKFQIGGAAFTGQMDSLLVDPGNSVH